MDRREFGEIVGLATSGLCIERPVSFLALFPAHSKRPLADEMPGPKVKVIGIGFAGCNMLDYVIKQGLKNVDFIAASQDPADLEERLFPSKIVLGEDLGNPCGLGWDSELAYVYSMDSRDTIRRRLDGSDVVIILAGGGGATATGGSPVVAQIAKELGIWTIGIVTVPFSYEYRTKRAQETISQLESIVDMLIVIPNDALRPYRKHSIRVLDAFIQSNAIVYQAVKAFSDIFLMPRMPGMDFKDIKCLFPYSLARIGVGRADRSPVLAVRNAFRSPLLGVMSITRAREIICDMNLGGNTTVEEIHDAVSLLQKRGLSGILNAILTNNYYELDADRRK